MSRKHSKSLKFFLWGLVLIVVGSLGWIAISGVIAFKNISAKNSGNQSSFFRFNGEIPPDQLLGEGDSRINILSLGVDEAAGLTDSIEVISIDPINKTLAMLSVPRDLYVFNAAENRKTKINEVYNSGVKSCSLKKSSCDPSVDAGGELMKKTVAETLGIPISYFTRVNFAGVKKIVDVLGGIEIYVDRPIYDPKFPNATNTGFDPFRISAGLQKMDGATALKYARSRQTTSDFDRARRQQQVIGAIREKGLTLNILANPKKITDIISAIGHNFKTDLQSNELYSVISLSLDINSSKTVSKVLDDAPDGPLRSSVNTVGQYILIPKLGEDDWTDVREIAESVLPEPYLVSEAAKIKIVDASGKSSVAEALKKKLTSLGYKVSSVEKSSSVVKGSTIVYFTDKPYTTALLKRRFGLTPTSGKSPTGTEDILFTIGSGFTFIK